jgi:hypothetical protein
MATLGWLCRFFKDIMILRFCQCAHSGQEEEEEECIKAVKQDNN